MPADLVTDPLLPWVPRTPSVGVVDVYWADLDAVGGQWPDPQGTLTLAEMDRARRFRSADLQHRYMAARGALRRLLGVLSGIHPRDLAIQVGPGGKLELEHGPAFNLSHSGNWLLVGVAPHGRLGVDIEQRREVSDALELARQACAADERAMLEDIVPGLRSELFLQLWTRKEALAKAIGTGLSLQMENVSVVRDEPSWQPVDVGAASMQARGRWQVRSLALEAPVLAAIAWDQPGFRVRHGIR